MAVAAAGAGGAHGARGGATRIGAGGGAACTDGVVDRACLLRLVVDWGRERRGEEGRRGDRRGGERRREGGRKEERRRREGERMPE